MPTITARGALAALLLISLQGCTSIRVDPSPTTLVAPPLSGTPFAPGSRIAVDASGMGGCTVMGGAGVTGAHAVQAAVQKAQAQLQQAGFQVIAAAQATPADFQLRISRTCVTYNSNGWLYLATIGVLPMWNNQALVVTSTLLRGNEVLGNFSQSYRVTDSMSLYSPSALLIGGASSVARFEQAFDFNPQLVASMASQAQQGN